jgi:peptidoglycan/LPS O-acetylase OafA/YrhL
MARVLSQPLDAQTAGAREASPEIPFRQLPRLGWADNLRVAVIAGVIVAHVGTAYLVEFDWYYMERTTNRVSQLVAGAVTGMGVLFGMGLLFLVAGIFTPGALQRKGAGRFALDRLLRLGLPLVVFVFVIDALADYIGWRGAGAGDDGFLTYYGHWWGEDADLSVMWFVAALLVFSLGFAAFRRARPAPIADPTPLTWHHAAGAIGVIAATSFLVRLVWPFFSQALSGLNLWEFPQMVTLFGLGVLAAERGWLDGPLSDRMRRACATAAVVGALAFLAILMAINPGDPDPAFTGGLRPQAAVLPLVEAFIAVGTSLWVVDWFRRRWNVRGALARRLARASYATYVIHPPVVVLLSVAMRSVPVPIEVKFLVVAVVGVACAFAIGSAATRWRVLARIV